MLYKLKKIEATKWLKNGDHPKDGLPARTGRGEGEIVRYFRHPDFPGDLQCLDCGHCYDKHGFIDQDGGIKVCPGSYVITIEPGKYDTVPANQFELFFKPVL